MKKNEKKSSILDALEQLILNGEGDHCSVSDIAHKAGIGKGTTYYYFSSKEEIFDALIERTYSKIIDQCEDAVHEASVSAIEKTKILFETYFSSKLVMPLDKYLHQPENAYIHQKSLAKILTSLTPILSSIIKQGIKEHTFICEYPTESAELILSEYCFLFDPGFFSWTNEEMQRKYAFLPKAWELILGAPKNSFSFLMSNLSLNCRIK